MIHQDTELRFTGNDNIGYGLFATRIIPKGTITWVFDELDIVLSREQLNNIKSTVLQSLVIKYSYIDDYDRYVLSWDNAKYMNHSCNANTLSPIPSFEIAICDIMPGEQIFGDYGYLRLEHPFSCKCDSMNCRGTLYASDLETCKPFWTERLETAITQMSKVNQPLIDFAHDETLRDIDLTDKSKRV